MESILTSIKKLLGLSEDYEAFDNDIIMYINAALSTLTQIGVGPSTGFAISDASDTWSDILPEDDPRYNSAIAYIGFKVRLMFDPPTSSFVLDSINNQIKELEWRLALTAEQES